MKKYFINIILLGSLLFSCAPETSHPTLPSMDPEVKEIDLNTQEIYDSLYNHKNKIDIILSFTNKSIQKLQEYGLTHDNRKDMYHPCQMTLIINDKSYIINEVGARMKGNTSRTNNFVDSKNRFNKERYLNFKLSFNQTFDNKKDNDYYIRTWENQTLRKQRKDRRLGKQKKIDTKWNKNFDNTFTKMSYAFSMFEQEGLVAQRDNIIRLTVKNETDSVTFLMDMMESIDSTFLKNHMKKEEAKGNLYKCLYQGGAADFSRTSAKSIGIETPDRTPIYDLKTNDDEPDHTLLKNLITTLNEDKRNAKEFKSTLDQMVDVENFLKFSALSWVIGNPDDMRNNYNNFYSYFRSSDNKLVIIPYDEDRCFGILHDWPMHTETYPYNSTLNLAASEDLRNPLFYRTIISGDTWYGQNFECIQEYKTKYENYCYEYAHKYLDKQKFEAYTKDFYYGNKNISIAGADNITFEQYSIEKLKVAPKSKY